MSDAHEESWRPVGRIIGYSNNGPLYSRPAPYRHTAYCDAGELGTTYLRVRKTGRPKKLKQPKKLAHHTHKTL